MNAMPACSHAASTSSELRSSRLYWFCTETIGAMRRASASSRTLTFDTPRWRILPAACASASVPIDSANGTLGSGAWNW